MYVQQLELLPERHLVLLRREGERVGVMVEQRIPAHPGLYLMEVHPLGVPAQAEWRVVGDEVHLVPAAGERQGQLGGDRAGSAVRRIAGYAQPHASVLLCQAAAISSASRAAGRVASNASTGPASWCRNQVSWRLA